MAYCTVTDVKTELGQTGTADDGLIGRKILSAQAWLENILQCVFEASGNTSRYFDASADVEGLELFFDYPAASIDEITNGDGTEVTSAQYVTEPRNTAPYWGVKILASVNKKWEYNSSTNDPENAIEVSANWAYSATAPADIKEACILLTAYLYRLKDSQVFDVTAIPEAGVITVPKGFPLQVHKIIEHYRERVRSR